MTPVDGVATTKLQVKQRFGATIGSWNVSLVASFESLFAVDGPCSERHTFNEDVSAWDTANVLSMRSVFLGNQAFNQPLTNWNTAIVTSMNYMFS